MGIIFLTRLARNIIPVYFSRQSPNGEYVSDRVTGDIIPVYSIHVRVPMGIIFLTRLAGNIIPVYCSLQSPNEDYVSDRVAGDIIPL